MPINNPRNLENIQISKGNSILVKDYRGFTVFEFKENGDLHHKGRVVKL